MNHRNVVTIAPKDESPAVHVFIQSMKLGSKRLSYAERTRGTAMTANSNIILFPRRQPLPAAANN